MAILLGADPELFIVDKAGTFISAHDIIPGSKKSPFQVECGAVQPDGVAAEFNIDPAETEDQFNRNIETVLKQMDEMVKKVDKDLILRFVPLAKFSERVWSSVPDQAKVLGCDPDFNVHGEVNENPIMRLEDRPIRTAAGHVHIGWTNVDDPTVRDHFEDCLYIAQGFYNAHLLSFSPNTQDEQERLRYYGHSGSFRPKKYGVELRAPSNVWVSEEKLRRKMFNEVRTTLQEITGM